MGFRRRIRDSVLSAYRRISPISPTGPSAEERREAEREHWNRVVAKTREDVFQRDGSCRFCPARGRLSDQMHEIESRAALRGKPPEEIFTTRNCVRACAVCHQKFTEHRLRIIVLTPAGADGPLAVVPWLDTKN